MIEHYWARGDAFRYIVPLVPLLLHLNHPTLPGYVEDAPAGIADFILSNYQQNFSKEHPELIEDVQSAVNSAAVFAPILGIYVMGSFGSIEPKLSFGFGYLDLPSR